MPGRGDAFPAAAGGRGSRPSGRWARRPSWRRSTTCSRTTPRSWISWPSGCPADQDPTPRHRPDPAHWRPLPGVPDLLAARAAEGADRRHPPCSSTRACSTAPPDFGSWACSRPSTTTVPRSSDQGSPRSWRVRKRSRPSSPATSIAGSRRSSRSTRRTRTSCARRSASTSRPTPSASHYVSVLEAYAGHPEQAARRRRRLGLWLLWIRQVQLRQDARPRDPEPRARGDPGVEALRRAGRRQQAHGPAHGDQREDPDPRRDLRRLHRPRHPVRQPDPDRDHVRALPPEPRVCEGPGPLRA